VARSSARKYLAKYAGMFFKEDFQAFGKIPITDMGAKIPDECCQQFMPLAMKNDEEVAKTLLGHRDDHQLVRPKSNLQRRHRMFEQQAKLK